MVRKHIIFSGRVQGVGFRYTSCYLARSLGLTGWVRNLCDGNVEMEVQGAQASIDQLTQRLAQGSLIHIDRMETEGVPVIRESSFRELY